MVERTCYADILIDSIHDLLERGEVEAAKSSAVVLKSIETEGGENTTQDPQYS